MSIGYVTQPDGSNDVITNVILDESSISQTLGDTLLNSGGGFDQIFFTDGIPMTPIAGAAWYFRAVDLRKFEAIDNRKFEA